MREIALRRRAPLLPSTDNPASHEVCVFLPSRTARPRLWYPGGFPPAAGELIEHGFLLFFLIDKRLLSSPSTAAATCTSSSCGRCRRDTPGSRSACGRGPPPESSSACCRTSRTNTFDWRWEKHRTNIFLFYTLPFFIFNTCIYFSEDLCYFTLYVCTQIFVFSNS